MPIVQIDYFLDKNLPNTIKKQAKEKNIKIKKGLVIVKTKIINGKIDFEIISIGQSLYLFTMFLRNIIKEDGGNPDEISNDFLKLR